MQQQIEFTHSQAEQTSTLKLTLRDIAPTKYQPNPIVQQNLFYAESPNQRTVCQIQERLDRSEQLPKSSWRQHQKQNSFEYAINNLHSPHSPPLNRRMELILSQQHFMNIKEGPNDLQQTKITFSTSKAPKNKTDHLASFSSQNMKIFLSEASEELSGDREREVGGEGEDGGNQRIKFDEIYNIGQREQIVEEEDIRQSTNGLREDHNEIPSITLLSPASPILVKEAIQCRKDFIKTNKLKAIKEQMYTKLSKNDLLKVNLQRKICLASWIWPEYSLKFKEGETLMGAKKTSCFPAKYVISANESNFQQNSSDYLGKVKSNMEGDVINIFGAGLNPKKAVQQHSIPRQLLATLVYEQVRQSQPIKFKVYIKKPQFHYYLHFAQMKLFKEEIPLHKLYQHPENTDKIEVYSNRQPCFNLQKRTYTLDFQGNARCPSIKNFILHNEESCKQLIIFGKKDDQSFSLSLAHIPPFIGFAVALATLQN